MARSLKKGPYVHHSLEKKVLKNVEENKKTVIKTWSRASLITPDRGANHWSTQRTSVCSRVRNRKHGRS